MNKGKNSVAVVRRFLWVERNGEEVTKVITEVYEKIVLWKKNSFMLSTGTAGKSYITEKTKLKNGCVNDSLFKNNVFKVIPVMSSVFLQKPSKTSKSKDHIKALQRRLDSW